MTRYSSLPSVSRASRAALGLALIAGVSVISLHGAPAKAATATSTLSVSASIGGSCTVGGAALSFGAYTSTAASTANGSIQVSCTNGTNAVVGLNQGINNNKAPSAGTRALNNGANFLGYDIYTDNTYTTVWNGTNTEPVNSTGTPVTLTAFGRIPAGQNPATGSYNDTVTVTVTF